MSEQKLLHVRNEEELRTLNAVIPAAIAGCEVVFGFTALSKAKMLDHKAEGGKLLTTGLPLDMAAEIGQVTVLRAWDKVLAGGGRSMGSQPAKEVTTLTIVNQKAYEAMLLTPEYQKAVGILADDETDAVSGEEADEAF
jgi:hypothetical protein